MAGPWTDPDQHVYAVGEVVTAGTLNTYVRQNIADLGLYGQWPRVFLGSVNNGTSTSPSTFYSQQSLATFQDPFTMIVQLQGIAAGNSGTCAVEVDVLDEGGSSIRQAAVVNPYQFNMTGYYDRQWVGAVGKKQYQAGQTAGFQMSYFVTSNNVYMDLVATVFFTRGSW